MVTDRKMAYNIQTYLGKPAKKNWIFYDIVSNGG